MKKVFTLLLSVFFIVCTQAQNVSYPSNPSPDSGGWVVLKDSAGIQFSVKEMNCNGNRTVLVRVLNANPENVSVKWGFWNAGDPEPADAALRVISVTAAASLEGVCPDTDKMTLRNPLFDFIYDNSPLNNFTFKITLN